MKRLVDILFTYEPFKSRKADFNVRALDLPDSESGVLRPDSKIFRRTPLSVQYGIFGSERYMLTYDDRALREAASAAPYDFLEILVNDARYGGGGIYNFQATASVDTGFAEYVFVHEFGHHFAGLADEYYGSDVAYETGGAEARALGAERDRLDPKALKWADLVESGTPLPTPWEKEAFEKQTRGIQAERRKLIASGAPPSALDDLFRRQMGARARSSSSHDDVVRQGRGLRGRRVRGEGPLPARRPTASCSRATRGASAPSAGGRSGASSTSTRGPEPPPFASASPARLPRLWHWSTTSCTAPQDIARRVADVGRRIDHDYPEGTSSSSRS